MVACAIAAAACSPAALRLRPPCPPPLHRRPAVAAMAPPPGCCCCCCCSSSTPSPSPFRHARSRPQRWRIGATGGGMLGVEPDLVEDHIEGSEYWTAGEDRKDEFPFGKADFSHEWHEGDDTLGLFEAIGNMIKEAGGPNDHPGQAVISWLYLPILFTGVAYGVQPEYLFLLAILFIFSFIGMEMTKPDKRSNFPP